MRPTSVLELASLLGGSAIGVDASLLATGWAWDSREVKPGDLFLAIKGERSDGHDHTKQALAAGAVAAVVERPVDGPHIHVEKLTAALAQMASGYRERFNGPVIGITGSAGKTTTKEFIAASLSPLGTVLKTEGNRNTEYTAPLLWTELTEAHRAVVVEMGMRGFGHIQHIAAFSRPTIGVITNIGVSHMELVGSREGIARAKGELLQALPTGGTSILWAEDEMLSVLKGLAPGPVKTFGASEVADCQVTGYQSAGWTGCHIEGSLDGVTWSADLPAVGRHVAIDAAAAVLTAVTAGVEPKAASIELSKATLPPMRMEVRTWNQVTFLLDAYNASPASMKAAIEVLGEGGEAGHRYAVIGEMRELGDASAQGHREIGDALVKAGVDGVLLYGEATKVTEAELNRAGHPEILRATHLSEIEAYLRSRQPGDAVLIKGSRSLELEKAVPK